MLISEFEETLMHNFKEKTIQNFAIFASRFMLLLEETETKISLCQNVEIRKSFGLSKS